MANNIKLKRVTVGDSINIDELNTLFDAGTVWNPRQGKKFLSDSNNALFIAYQKSKMAGFLSANRLQRYDKRKAEILLYGIGVKKRFRKLGIGKLLVESVKDWGVSQGADEVWLLTNKLNIAANKLYQSRGGELENPDYAMYIFKL